MIKKYRDTSQSNDIEFTEFHRIPWTFVGVSCLTVPIDHTDPIIPPDWTVRESRAQQS